VRHTTSTERHFSVGLFSLFCDTVLMRAFVVWMKRVCHWMAEPWWVWVTAGVPAVCILLPGSLLARVNYCGGAFEFLGIISVAWGVRGKSGLFKRPTVFAECRSWLSRFPQYGGQHIVLVGDTAGISISGSATLGRGDSSVTRHLCRSPFGGSGEERGDSHGGTRTPNESTHTGSHKEG
jgi:hypothetical protein